MLHDPGVALAPDVSGAEEEAISIVQLSSPHLGRYRLAQAKVLSRGSPEIVANKIGMGVRKHLSSDDDGPALFMEVVDAAVSDTGRDYCSPAHSDERNTHSWMSKVAAGLTR